MLHREGGTDDLQRARCTLPEGGLDEVVALPRGVALRDDLDRRHPGLQSEDRQGERDEDRERRRAVEKWPPPESLGPGGEQRRAVLAGVHPFEGQSVDARPELGEHGGEQGHRREQDEDDGDHDPEGHRAEGGARDEHHGGEGDQDRGAGEQHRLAGGVHRLGDGVARAQLRAEEGAAEAVHDEEGVVDPEREREHEREVHRPDRDVEEPRAEVERPGRGDEPEDRQHQRQAGGDERAEREQQDHERDGPGEELRLHHRVAVGDVEVRPHARGARQADLHAVGAGGLQIALQGVGGSDHLGRRPVRAGADDRGVPVLRDREAGPRQRHRRHPRVSAQDARDAVDRGRERRVTDPRDRGMDDDHQGRARLAAEMPVDQRARLHRLRAGCLPARARESCLDPRRQHPEADGDDDPGDEHGAEVVGRPGAKPTDGADRRHRPAPSKIAFSSASCRCTLPQTVSQSSKTPASTTR